MAHDEYVAARQLEETLHISDIFAATIALPRQAAAESELTAEADGDDGADVGEFPSLHEISRAQDGSTTRISHPTEKVMTPSDISVGL